MPHLGVGILVGIELETTIGAQKDFRWVKTRRNAHHPLYSSTFIARAPGILSTKKN